MANSVSKPVKFKVTLTDSSGKWFNNQISLIDRALEAMGNTILKNSQMVVPRKNNYLVNSAKLVKGNQKVAVVYEKPYAAYQERGERYDGTHKVKRYTTPNTGKNYLEKTGHAVVERGIRWFLSHS